ncbi:hypothetical protein GCM10009623_19230 [Nocardioides aestuarii]|uniref:Heavy-metal-associated domain-containing protein n=1 Tax=Nocardioides aestuarii TaxID=252231 RepID=A0ABW4TKT7_9ACTN
MSTPVRIAGFVLGLVAVFLAARGVGAVANPVDVATPVAHDDMGAAGHDDGGHTEQAVAHAPGGLQTSEQGYTLRVVRQQPLRFTVDGPDGHAVTAYDVVHDQPLHLVKVRRDGTGYQHVHPTMADDGTWTARLDLEPGSNRVIADFTPTGGPELVLGADVEVSGTYAASPAPAVSRTDRVGPYEVTLAGDLEAGGSSPLTATVTRDGEPVTDLQPYLGAYGHLVALREGDLAYLHVHPEESAAGPDIPFVAEVPSVGRYRLFLDFKLHDVVHTAAFVLEVDGHDH